MSKVTLPALLREVRKAISHEDYVEAERLYWEILAFPDMADDLDARLRYAYCSEKNGHLSQKNCHAGPVEHRQLLTAKYLPGAFRYR